MKRLLLAVCLMVYTQAGAQNGQGPILLTNHSISPDAINLDFSKDEVVNGRFYRIVQSTEMTLKTDIPSVEILEYLPKNAFIISIDASERAKAERALRDLDITSAVKMQGEWKLSKRLFTLDIPEWAWLDNNNFKVWVRYFSDLDQQFVKNQLSEEGYPIVDQKKQHNLIALAVNTDQIKTLAALPFLVHVQEMEDPGEPENYTARSNHRVNYLQANFPGSVHYDGSGVVVGHGDDGAIGDHIDYSGRLIQNAPPSDGDHGDHVAGTIFGAGNKDPRGRGMAPGAEIYYQDYPDNLNNADTDFNTQNVRITASSYSNGCNAGYTNFTLQLDQDAVDNPEMLHIFSAGNSGNNDCGYGAGSNWGNVTGGHKIAKNAIAVANLTNTDGLSSSSSRGPASDGRIKPDIGAVGSQVYSTTDVPVPNSYTNKTGTSMSCPGVAGVLATLYQAYRENNNGQDPHGGLLKAIALNTAEDLGNPGPDFRYGYGRINARRAHKVIADGNYIVDSMSSGTKNYSLSVPSGNVKEVRIMLYWPDLPASTAAARALVNDLDLDVNQGSSSYQPWVLDPTPNPANLNSNAVRARDSLNNMEQVTIANPGSGNLSVDVSAFNIPSGDQKFFLTYEFVMDEVVLTYPVGGEGFAPGQTELIRWDATESNTDFNVDYSIDSGASWSSVAGNVSSNNLHTNWSVPNTPTDQAMLRVIRGQDTSTSPGTFVIAGVPTSFNVYSNCPDSIILSWDSVAGVSGYNLYRLGTTYMDSIAFTTDTSIVIPQNSPVLEDWYSVSSVVNGKSGQRAIAVKTPTKVTNCQLQEDLWLANLLSPLPGISTTCFPSSGIPVTIKLTNAGMNILHDFYVSYSFNGGAVITDTITDTISPGNDLIYSFKNSSLNLVTGNNYSIDVWVDYNQDQNQYNDTLHEEVMVISGSLKNLPYSNDFEGFNLCGTSNDCGGTTCNLNDGWINLTNSSIDDIDFRTNTGSTPSQNTGPFEDLNPGTTTGKYLYLEASAGCDSSEAILFSPCLYVDSTIATQPMVEFGYHMYGVDMGRLQVDLITKDGVVENAIPEQVGNHGNTWTTGQINLTPYLGRHVIVRFTGKTGLGYRSDLALDDFRFFDNAVQAPVAGLTTSDTGICTSDTVTFQDMSTGNVSSYLWDFGQGATPRSATTAGPHQVVYSSGGNKQVSLEVSNLGGFSKSTLSVPVRGVPGAAFSYAISLNKVTFTDVSSYSPHTWQWDFGDGNTSNQQNPVHTYQSPGTYGVSLTVDNGCGTASYTDSVYISSIGLNENILTDITIYPNPAKSKITVTLPTDLKQSHIRISDLSGRLIHKVSPENIGIETEIDLQQLPVGVYLLEVSSNKGLKTFKVVKN